MNSQKNLDDRNMHEPGADADAPTSQKQAVEDGQQPAAEERINAGETQDQAAIDDVLALHKFLSESKEDDVDAAWEAQLRDLLGKSSNVKILVDSEGPDGIAAIHLAAERGLAKAVQELINAGADTSIRDKDAWQPLHYACDDGHLDVAKLLIGNGADLNAQDQWNETPLHKACRNEQADLVELLLKKGAKTNIFDDVGMPPLYYTARFGRIAALKVLLGKSKPEEGKPDGDKPDGDKPNIDYVVRDDNGWTALHVAAYYGHVEVVAILHEAQADLDLRDDKGSTPLLLATRREHLEVMRELLCDGEEDEDREGHLRQREGAGNFAHAREPPPLAVAQIESKDSKDEVAPLMMAAANGFLAGVQLLMKHGADCNTRDADSRTPIINASRWRNREVVSALLERKQLSKTSDQDEIEHTSLLKVASRGCEEPADINAHEMAGQTALHKAARLGHAKVVKLLLENGADVRIQDGKGRLPLHLASFQGNVAVANLLLEYGARQQLETRDLDGMTPLHIACKAGKEDVEHPSPDNLGPEDLNEKESSMPDFKSGRHSAVVELLLENKAGPDTKTANGETALRLALDCQYGKDEKLQHLTRYMRLNNEEAPLSSTLKTSASDATSKDFVDLLDWAAEDRKRHYIAESLIRKHFASSAPPPPEGSSVFAYAAWANLPGVLRLLVINTPFDENTLGAIKSLQTPKTPVSQSQQVTEQGNEHDTTGQQMEDYSAVQEILRDPPLGFADELLANMHTDSEDFELPKAGDPKYLDRFGAAAVVQFYKGKNRYSRIRRSPTVQEVIYSKGPQSIIEPWMRDAKRLIKDLEPSFTWVHLPSTNVSLKVRR